MYKTIEAVTEALNTPIEADQLRKVRGSGGREYDYVPWNITAKLLNAIFGQEGWTESIEGTHFDAERGIYTVTRTITGYATVGTGKDEHVVHISRTGVGVGIVNGDHASAHDTAIKAADSDSFSRAAKKFGPALGLNLYDKDDPANRGDAPQQRSYQGGSSYQSGGNSRPPSEAQMRFLSSLGYDREDVIGMSFAEWKGILDNKTQKPGTTPKPRRAAVAEREPDDIPF